MRYLKKQYLIPFFLLSFPLVIDCVNGLMKGTDGSGEGSLGIVYRGLIIVISIKYLFRQNLKLYLLFLYVLFLFCILYWTFFKSSGYGTVTSFVKMTYPYFLLAILLRHKRTQNVLIVINFSLLYGVGAAIVLIVCGLFGVGYSSYVEGTFGTKGLFIAMNDVGLVLLMLNCLSLYVYQKNNQNKYLLSSLLMSISCLMVGSMACYFGTLLILFFLIVSVFFVKFKDYKSSLKLRCALLVVIFLVSFYLVRYIVKTILDDPFLSNKYSDLSSTFLEVSGRGALIESANKLIKNATFFDLIFGMGDSFSYSIGRMLGLGNTLKLAEVDILDLLGTYGIILTSFFIYYPIKATFFSVKLFIKSKEKDLLLYWICIICLLFLGHSYYGGHAITSPLSSSYFIICVYLLCKNKNFVC